MKFFLDASAASTSPLSEGSLTAKKEMENVTHMYSVYMRSPLKGIG